MVQYAVSLVECAAALLGHAIHKLLVIEFHVVFVLGFGRGVCWLALVARVNSLSNFDIVLELLLIEFDNVLVASVPALLLVAPSPAPDDNDCEDHQQPDHNDRQYYGYDDGVGRFNLYPR